MTGSYLKNKNVCKFTILNDPVLLSMLTELNNSVEKLSRVYKDTQESPKPFVGLLM